MPIVAHKKTIITAGQGHECLCGSQFSDWMFDLAKKLKRYIDHFDTIVCRGKSGMLAAGFLSAYLTKNTIVIRKNTNNSHAVALIEYFELPNKYIIVDDFISSGATIMNIIRKMEKLFPNAELTAIALYDNERDCESDFTLSEKKKIQELWEILPIFTPDAIYNESLLHL
jgi:hypoxanthine phosphoribosyltransferase